MVFIGASQCGNDGVGASPHPVIFNAILPFAGLGAACLQGKASCAWASRQRW